MKTYIKKTVFYVGIDLLGFPIFHDRYKEVYEMYKIKDSKHFKAYSKFQPIINIQ